MKETELIQAARSGDLEAFNQLVLAHQDTVYNQAYWLLKNQEAAEDLAQEAFLLAYKNLERFRGGSFRAWLLRIVRNASIDELRRWKRAPVSELIFTAADTEEDDTSEWLPDTGPGVEERVEQNELRDWIEQELEALPQPYQSVVVYVDLMGLDYSEAAEALQVPVGTVKSRLARARLRLRETLDGYGERELTRYTSPSAPR